MTGPASVFLNAPTGQADTQAGSVQCMHWFLTNDHTGSGLSALSSSVNWIRVYVFALSSLGFVKLPERSVSPVGRSFHDLQATWQPRHPMQRVRSTSTPFVFSVFVAMTAPIPSRY